MKKTEPEYYPPVENLLDMIYEHYTENNSVEKNTVAGKAAKAKEKELEEWLRGLEGMDALGEYKLRKYLHERVQRPTSEYENEEMEANTDIYAEFIISTVERIKETCPHPLVMVEERLDYSYLVPSGFGTGDCVIIADGTLYVMDYKNGKIAMKTGRNLQKVLVELNRQNQAKQDFISPAQGMYDIGDGLILMNVINKNEDGKMHRITTYIGIEEKGFVCVGNANDLDVPGLYSVISFMLESRKQCSRF